MFNNTFIKKNVSSKDPQDSTNVSSKIYKFEQYCWDNIVFMNNYLDIDYSIQDETNREITIYEPSKNINTFYTKLRRKETKEVTVSNDGVFTSLLAQDDFEYRRRIFGNLTATTDGDGRVVSYFKDNQFRSSKYSVNITQFYDKWIPIVLAKTSSSVTLQIYSFSGNPMPNVEITMSVDINGVTY